MNGLSLAHLILAVIVAFALYWAAKNVMAGFYGVDQFCTTCGHQGETRTHTSGSLVLEIVLWLCFIVPGLIYSVWRHTTRGEVCGSCGAETLVPAGSPVAVKMRKELA